jgi:hypothetical protein
MKRGRAEVILQAGKLPENAFFPKNQAIFAQAAKVTGAWREFQEAAV